MRVPEILARAFDEGFERQLVDFCLKNQLVEEEGFLTSKRFLNRSIIPHIQKLSQTFNRLTDESSLGSANYWTASANPDNFRLAYFLYFMPANAFRVASVFSELGRLGYRFPSQERFHAVEIGSGPAAGAAGVAFAQKYSELEIPENGRFALIEQDKKMLDMGAAWLSELQEDFGLSWDTRTFHRKIEAKDSFLPKNAPEFDLILMSYYLNEVFESGLSPADTAKSLLETVSRHLKKEGILVLVEPALREQSRKVLEMRKALIELKSTQKKWGKVKVLLPCLGEQACGALSSPDDWCHEEVKWWRPGYVRMIDQLAGLNRMSLPFTYLVLANSDRSIEEILPGLKKAPVDQTARLVSPVHKEGKDLEFFICTKTGKKRARYRPGEDEELERGTILQGLDFRGDENSTRIEGFVDKLG